MALEFPPGHAILSLHPLYLIAEQPAAAHPGGCAALRIVPVTVPRVTRSVEHFSDGFDLHLLPSCDAGLTTRLSGSCPMNECGNYPKTG